MFQLSVTRTLSLCTSGPFYSRLSQINQYSDDLKSCIEETVSHLQQMEPHSNRPGMLLGKIQSGKTRAFIGIMSLAFDNGYDAVIILTKGTVALAHQTYQRLTQEFYDFIQADQAQVFDIMNYPGNLRKYELRQKLIFVAKKEKRNLERLHDAFFVQSPELANKKILIIDDEADFASIGFEKTRDEIVKIRTIADLIDALRTQLADPYFLQVTATPYSLYLQPEDLHIGENKTFMPTQPAFTVLVPVHDKYIGGDFYFRDSQEEESIASYLYEEVDPAELRVLKKSDRRSFKIEEVLTSRRIASLRNAVVNFIVGGCIRRIQGRRAGQVGQKYSFIIHTEQSKNAHSWQEDIVTELEQQLIRTAEHQSPVLRNLVAAAYDNLLQSIQQYDLYIPSFDEVLEEVTQALLDEFLMVVKVNSEKAVSEMLDESGQLKLRSPLNIFIGGQILDRGITIGNLIGFYYGRNPKTYQQDTVLQHSRMYGARPLEDLTVTRFYTTKPIYDVMNKIHEFDAGLREAFERGGQDKGVVFIQKDLQNQIIPCSPNKIMLSKVTTLKPFKRLLPIGFQTEYKTHMKQTLAQLDGLIRKHLPADRKEDAFLVDLATAKSIVEKIIPTLLFDEEGYDWDAKAFLSSLEYLSANTENEKLRNRVWLVVREGRHASRKDSRGRFADAPDTPKGFKGESRVAREAAVDIPALILLRQEGREEEGWRGSPFWWPVLVAPQTAKTVVFASKAVE